MGRHSSDAAATLSGLAVVVTVSLLISFISGMCINWLVVPAAILVLVWVAAALGGHSRGGKRR